MANLKQSKTTINVGIDVGKIYLDVHIHEKNVFFRDKNNSEGVKNILKRLSYYKVKRIVMEATGRYEFLLAEAAHHKDLPVCIVKPLVVRRYAGAINQLAKTDKIDAQLLAQFAAVIKPVVTPQKSKNLIGFF